MAHWLGQYLFGQPLVIITDAVQLTVQEPVFNYSDQPLSFHSFWVKPCSLLFETGIFSQNLQVKEAAGLPRFFETDGDSSFDILAASFYLLQRYEEYLPHEKDKHGRFAHTGSLAFRHRFLQLPLVDLWMQELKKALLQKFPQLYFTERHFQFIPTYDVDIAFAYRGKGLWKNLWSLYRNLTARQLEAVMQQADFVLQGQADPFDVFDELVALHSQHELQPVFFFLLAQKQQGIDKNINPGKKSYRQLIQKLSAQSKTGIHFSGAASASVAIMVKEKTALENEINQPATRNRMHYLLLHLPETYRQLLQLGIGEDYTMGYGTANGFRASTCTPYLWYDLQTEKSTGLQIFPFCYMDAVSIFKEESSPAGAFQEMERLRQMVQKVKGCFISIFHNHFIGKDRQGKQWMEIYKNFVREIIS